MESINRRLNYTLIGRGYSKWIRSLFPGVLYSVACTLPSCSITGRVTATFSLVFVDMLTGYSQADITLNCSSFLLCIFKVIIWRPRLVAAIRSIPIAACTYAPVFVVFSGYILRHFNLYYFVWRIAISELVICSLISFLGFALEGTDTFGSTINLVIHKENGLGLSLPLCFGDHFEQYGVF